MTNDHFGPAAAKLAGFCCLAFGWSPDAFWRATPAEVACLVAALVSDGGAPVTRRMMAELEKSCG